jgi:cephalosporin hydroxylase
MKSYQDIVGFFNYEKIYYDNVMNSYDGDVFVEVGSLWGRSVIYMGQACKQFNKNIKIYAVDYWDYRGVPELMTPGLDPSGLDYEKDGPDCLYDSYLKNLKDCGVDDIVTSLRLSSEDASKTFDDDSVDFIFIDANHTYESVMNDLKCWYKKIKPGKIISGHDYDWDGVRTAVNDFFGEGNISTYNTSWIYQKPVFDIDSESIKKYNQYNLYRNI